MCHVVTVYLRKIFLITTFVFLFTLSLFTTDVPVFKIVSSRAEEAGDSSKIPLPQGVKSAPVITVHFANGIKDDLVLEEYKINKDSPASCNYIGRLRSHPSSVAVTGCMEKPGDRMEITLFSEYNRNSMMYAVDFSGNTQVIENPFKNGGL